MRILVVCGAGASSTFVAQRVRHAAHNRGLEYIAFAGTEQSLPIDLDAADVVLVGPHLAHALTRIERDAALRGTTVVLLPSDIFNDLDGTRTLELVRAAVGGSGGTLSAAGSPPSPPANPVNAAGAPETSDHPPHDERKDRLMPLTRTVRIGSSHGLHARPAKLFAQAAKEAGIPITIAKDAGKPVNAASILGVIPLGIEQGDYITLTADGENAEAVLDTLSELLATDHDAE